MVKDVAPVSAPSLRLFDVSEYGRMLEGTYFDEDCRVDLVSGNIIHIVELVDDPHGEHHAWKSRVYARHGIGSLWIVDLHQQHIIDHAVAEPEGYVAVQTYSRRQAIPGLLSIDPHISVAEILG